VPVGRQRGLRAIGTGPRLILRPWARGKPYHRVAIDQGAPATVLRAHSALPAIAS
jgi:hypothetical protein